MVMEGRSALIANHMFVWHERDGRIFPRISSTIEDVLRPGAPPPLIFDFNQKSVIWQSFGVHFERLEG